jgi:hypothetical protein
MASNLTARLKAREPYKHPLGLMLEDLEDVAERTILLGQGDYPTVRRLVMQVVADMAEAADLLAAKDAEIARLTAELDEQARLNGMGAEREAALRGEVERLKAAEADMRACAAEWSEQANRVLAEWGAAVAALAQREAECARLRMALETIANGDTDIPAATVYRADGKHSKLDMCPHGQRMYEGCQSCVEDFARAALSDPEEDNG